MNVSFLSFKSLQDGYHFACAIYLLCVVFFTFQVSMIQFKLESYKVSKVMDQYYSTLRNINS